MKYNIKIFSDFIWPFCYVATGIVAELKKNYEIEDNWYSFEIHPEVPPFGEELSEIFPNTNLKRMKEMLNISGHPYGIQFGDFTKLSNSNLAIQASEYARDMEKYHEFHELMFKAYFTDCKDIGSMDVIDEVALKCNLNLQELHKRIEEKYYKERLKSIKIEAENYKINSIPTFIVNGEKKIVGAVSMDEFERVLKDVF